MFHILKNKKALFLIILAFLTLGSIYIINTFLMIGPGLPPAEGMAESYLIDSNTYDSLFPFISVHTASESHSDSLVLIVWYFEKDFLFQEGEKTLSDYLLKHGQTEVVELDLTKELDTTINATKYEGGETSGYFIVYKNPFLETREDYFITYYGTTDTLHFSDQKNGLMYLIARSYHPGSGNVTALNE